jgi:hypothetical protein
MKTEIDFITEQLKTETSPIKLVDYLTKLSGWGSYYDGLLEPINKMKPEKWLKIQAMEDWQYSDDEAPPLKRVKPLSDKKTEMVWLATPEGQKELEYTSLLKRIDRMSTAIKQNLWSKKIEFRNLNPDV